VRFSAAAVVVVALAGGGAAMADPPSGSGLDQEITAGFCGDAPTGPDTRIASAVNALGVSAPTTPPIAILDTGVAGDLPELSDRVGTPFDATSGGTDAGDVMGHGSQVAAIAAGSSDKFRGISPTSPIVNTRVFNFSGDSTVPWLIGGINWALVNHAAVINVSSTVLESDVSAADAIALERATTDAFNKGVLIVASVGNKGTLEGGMPADLPHVIGVGASGMVGDRATFSDVGPWVDLVSPAAQLVAPTSQAFCPSGWGVVNGTSFAAPAVAGAAALLTQLRPELTVQQRFDVLRKSAHDVEPGGRDDETGYGLLDVQAALSAPAPAKQSSQEVDDDPVYVRGPYAASHPVLLTKSRRVRLTGELSPAKDPSDVYRVQLKKGWRLTASTSGTVAAGLLALGFWKPTVGDYDVSTGTTKNQVVSTGGFTDSPALKMKAPRSGTYYVSVEAPDPVDSDDPTAEPPAIEPYKLTLAKTPPLKRKTPAKTKAGKR
jgi:hypothetical protein